MSNFKEAFDITMDHEGKYSNDKTDIGGETYYGISRRYHPKWKGWDIIDNVKANFPEKDYDKILSNDIELNELVYSFYIENYWDRFLGDEIPDQDIANELFDSSVNMGVQRSIGFLQKSLNVLNRNQKDYNDIVEDGVIGSSTLNTLNKFLKIDNSLLLLKVMNIFQGMHYIDFMTKIPKQEKFARGWFKRVSFK